MRNGVRGLVALICVSLASLGTIAATDGQSGQVTVTAVMADATPLRDGNTVRASGVQVGTIQSVTLNDHGQAVVNMLVDRDVLPLHSDATATLIPQDLLGERFVLLDPGTASKPAMNEPYTIPIGQTKSAVDVQSVVDMVDDPTGTSLGALFTTLGEGLGKNPQDTADAIKAFKPALEQTQELAQVLSDQNQLLSHLVQNAQPVASAAATQQGQSLDHLVGSVTNTLQVTAANRQQIQDTLTRLPGTLQSAQTTLGHIAGLAPPTTRTLKNIRPITNDLKDVSKELRNFSDSADPTLSELRPVFRKGTRLIKELRPVIEDLNHGGGEGLKGVSRSYQQLADGALSTRLVDLMETMKGWSESTSDYDAFGHYFKANPPYTAKTAGQNFTGPIPGAPQNPVPNLPFYPRGGRAPVPGGGAEGAPNERGPYPPQLGHGNPEAGQDDKGGKGATGLSSDQENSMMDQMLGGN